MSYNGAGTYSLPAGQPVVTGTVISSATFNVLTADIATAFNTAWCRDGQAVPTANIPMNAFKLTGLSAATAAGQSLRWESTSDFTEDTTPDLIADFIAEYDTSALSPKKVRLATLLGLAAPPGQGVLLNGKVVTSVSSNALTIAIKGADGNDPSASNPVFVAFRSATLTDGGFTVRKITAALSVVVSSGSTLGHASGSACHLFAYLIDNSGTVELAVSNLPPDYPGTFANTRLISTTAEGGAGAADSATGIYSTTARSNVPWVCVAMMKSTQTTAGTWAANMTQVDQAPFRIPRCEFSATGNAVQLLSSGVAAKLSVGVETYDADSVYSTSTYRHQPNIAGYYDYDCAMGWGPPSSTQQYYVAGYKNGSEFHRNQGESVGTNFVMPHASMKVLMNGTTDYMEMYGYQNSGGNSNIDISDPRWAHFSGHRVAGGQ